MEAITENQQATTEEDGEGYDYPLFREAVMNGFAGANANGAPAPGQAAIPAGEPAPSPREQNANGNPAPPEMRMVDVGLQKSVTDAGAGAALAGRMGSAGQMAVKPNAGDKTSTGTATGAAGSNVSTQKPGGMAPGGAARSAGTGQTQSGTSGGVSGAAGVAKPGLTAVTGTASTANAAANPDVRSKSGAVAKTGSTTVQPGTRAQSASQSAALKSSERPADPQQEGWFAHMLHQTEDLLGIPRGTVKATGQNKTQTLDPNAKRGTAGSAQYSLVKAQDDARNDRSNQPERDLTKSVEVKKHGVVQKDPKTGEILKENPIKATHCNRATYQVIRAMDGDVSPLSSKKTGKDGKVSYTPYDANTQCANLAKEAANPNGSYRVITAKEAIELARQGKAVIAAQPYPKHGHIATLRPDNLETEKVESKGQPLISNVGGHVGVTHQTGAFYTNPPVVYYVQR